MSGTDLEYALFEDVCLLSLGITVAADLGRQRRIGGHHQLHNIHTDIRFETEIHRGTLTIDRYRDVSLEAPCLACMKA